MKYLTAILIVLVLQPAQASDPAGAWSTCIDNNTGTKKIIVEGPRCPRGWRKVYA
jgi:hypothetical protein